MTFKQHYHIGVPYPHKLYYNSSPHTVVAAIELLTEVVCNWEPLVLVEEQLVVCNMHHQKMIILKKKWFTVFDGEKAAAEIPGRGTTFGTSTKSQKTNNKTCMHNVDYLAY